MATTRSQCTIRPVASLAEAHAIFWPLMLSLGWDRGIADSTTHFHSTGGPAGFLVATPADSPTKPEGMIVPLVYANNTGWIAFFCVNEAFRRHGWGARLFQAALDRFVAQGTRYVGLDAVEEQLGTYSRRGFVAAALVDVRARPALCDLPAAIEDDDASTLPLPQGTRLVPLADVARKTLVAYDAAQTGLERARLWSDEALFSRQDVYGFAAVDDGKRASAATRDTLSGLVLVRGCASGYRIGPLYAESVGVARALLAAAVGGAKDADGRFNVELWRNNGGAAGVFEDVGFGPPLVSYHRMWLRGDVPEEQKPGGVADRAMYAIFDAGGG